MKNARPTRTDADSGDANSHKDSQKERHSAHRHEEARGGPTKALQPGTRAPHFNLCTTADQRVDLEDFRGHPVVLVFYPADWSPVCGDQLALYNEILPEFKRHDAQLVGISVDGVWCHSAYAQNRKLHFPLLADFEPKGAVAREYGAYRAGDGVIRWSHVSPLGVNPGADGILNALESLSQSREVARA